VLKFQVLPPPPHYFCLLLFIVTFPLVPPQIECGDLILKFTTSLFLHNFLFNLIVFFLSILQFLFQDKGEGVWETVATRKFLVQGKSASFARAFWIPFVSEKYPLLLSFPSFPLLLSPLQIF
jgi:hypothetical protein